MSKESLFHSLTALGRKDYLYISFVSNISGMFSEFLKLYYCWPGRETSNDKYWGTM